MINSLIFFQCHTYTYIHIYTHAHIYTYTHIHIYTYTQQTDPLSPEEERGSKVRAMRRSLYMTSREIKERFKRKPLEGPSIDLPVYLPKDPKRFPSLLLFVYICICVCVCMCICVCMDVWMYVCMYICMYVCMCVCLSVYMCTCLCI